MDGTGWSGWNTLTTCTQSPYSYNAGNTEGLRTKYRIAAVDTLGGMSGYIESNYVTHTGTPNSPMIVAPVNGATIYNTNPLVLIYTGGTPDNRTQKVCVKIGNGAWANNVDNPEDFSVDGNLGNNVATIYRIPAIGAGSHTVAVKCANDSGESAIITRTLNVASITLPLGAYVLASEMNALRTAVNDIRHYYGLPITVWGEQIIAKRTPIAAWRKHISDIRSAIHSLVDFVNGFESVTDFDITIPTWIDKGTDRPRKDVMQQLLTLIQTL
jgi:hypothetical protein